MAAEPIATLRGIDLAQAVIRGAKIDDDHKYDLIFLVVEGRLVAQIWDAAHKVSVERAIETASNGGTKVRFIG